MRARVVAVVLLLAVPVFAAEDFASVVKQALGSAEPTTAILRGLAKLDDVELDGAKVQGALAESGATADGQVALVLSGVTRVTKKKDRVTIERKDEPVIPIVVGGKTKGWVKLSKKLEFRMRADGAAILLDDFSGAEIGKTEKSLYDLKSLGWAPGEPDSMLTIKAGVGIFTQTETFGIPNAPVETKAAAPATPATTSATPGLLGKLGSR